MIGFKFVRSNEYITPDEDLIIIRVVGKFRAVLGVQNKVIKFKKMASMLIKMPLVKKQIPKEDRDKIDDVMKYFKNIDILSKTDFENSEFACYNEHLLTKEPTKTEP